MNDEPTPAVIVAEAAALIAAVATLVSGSTSTIMARLDENARGATERWRLHDAELERNREAITRKFVAIEERLDAHIVLASEHFRKDHESELVMQARVRPVKTGIAWIIANWKTVALIVGLVLGWLLLGVESIEHLTP